MSEDAERLARRMRGAAPAWLRQVGAIGDNRRHPAGPCLSIAFVGTAPEGPAALADTVWFPVDRLPPLAPRHRLTIAEALDVVRARLDEEPVAFRLLGAAFTLGDLQRVYELILGRRLHKASFRRALHAARLVEPTQSWRAEGRGRPAQLFRVASRKRRPRAHAPRFDRLGG